MADQSPITSPDSWISDELTALSDEGLLRTRRTVIPKPGGRCEIDGLSLINFATNDYLGLAFDPRLAEAAHAAIDECGTGSRASPLVTGRTQWHERLEQRIAAFEGTQAALVFPTGYAANVGTLAALVGPGDVVFSDRLDHASLIDGCRLSGARIRVYPHRDAGRLEAELQKAPPTRRLIVTDGLFSMDGDVAPLPDLCELAERHGAMLLVDEAHATGVLGAGGRGAAQWLGVEQRVPVRVGTLSKAAGLQGGFVAGSRTLIDWLWNRARTQMFSTALAPALCAAAIQALDIIANEPERRARLAALSERLTSLLIADEVPVIGNPVGPIIPVHVGDEREAVQLSEQLQKDGVLVPAIRPPTVPRGTSRLRISLSAAHNPDDVHRLADFLLRMKSRR